ncbi:MAG: N-acetylglucosaminyl-diphospho-decaprenol L-rhamnosyltransferase [Actinomycetota bacterium]|nr:N-acetylglucosaminyl-diphospho-decaprenol L-rhamnosyltransferase [Actinomycetota bacterium]
MTQELGAVPTEAFTYEVVLVTYRSRDLAAEMFERLPDDVRIVVVDNSKGVDGVPELVAGRPGARYLEGAGEGFARAANAGARTSTADVVLFLNPDTTPAVEQLEALVADLAADPGLGAVAATTVRPDGRVELGVAGWEPTAKRAFVHAVGLHTVFRSSGLYARPTPYRPIRVDWMTGACLAVPRERFLALGGFDEGFFLYNEDMAYGRRVRLAGLRQRLRTDVLVPHVGGGSGAARTRMFQMRGASMVAYVADHNPPSTVLGLRIALSLGTLARSFVARARGNSDLAAEHRAYVRGLWSGAPDMS